MDIASGTFCAPILINCQDRTLVRTSRSVFSFFFQAEDGIRDLYGTGVQTCALPICQTSDLPDRGRLTTDPAGSVHFVLPFPGARRPYPYLSSTRRRPQFHTPQIAGAIPAPGLFQTPRWLCRFLQSCSTKLPAGTMLADSAPPARSARIALRTSPSPSRHKLLLRCSLFEKLLKLVAVAEPPRSPQETTARFRSAMRWNDSSSTPF